MKKLKSFILLGLMILSSCNTTSVKNNNLQNYYVNYYGIPLFVNQDVSEIVKDLGEPIHKVNIEDKIEKYFYKYLSFDYNIVSKRIEVITIFYYDSYNFNNGASFKITNNTYHVKEISVNNLVAIGDNKKKIISHFGIPNKTLANEMVILYESKNYNVLRFDLFQNTVGRISLSLPNELLTKYGTE